MTETPCPDEDTLIAFAAGQSSTDLEAHLSSCRRCRKAVTLFLTEPHDVGGQGRGQVSQVGRYQVTGVLGEGTMGRVFVAFDPVLERTVAVKVLHALNESAEARAQLLTEAKALARVAHPHLVTVFDAGMSDGVVYLAMELVHGTTLRVWQRAPGRTHKQILDAYLQAARGLEAMHHAGLVHRDFKPENVLVGDDGRVRVSDFGLAAGRPASSPPADRALATPVGTPAYMAPEQWVAAPVDARADQFSWCCALVEALTGQRPFSTTRAADVTGPPNLGDLPRRQAAVLRRGLSSAPEQRYPTMAALVRALQPVTLSPVVVAVAAVVVVLTVVGAGWWSHQQSLCRGPDARAQAVWGAERRGHFVASLESKGPGAAKEAPLLTQAVTSVVDAWHTLAKENCEATLLRHEQLEPVYLAKARCLDRRMVELETLVDVIEHANEGALRQARDAVNDLVPPSVCSSPAEYDAKNDRPENPKLAERADALERGLAKVDALIDLGQLTEAQEAVSPLITEAQALPWPTHEAQARLFLAQIKRYTSAPDFEPNLRAACALGLSSGNDAAAVGCAHLMATTLLQHGERAKALEWQWLSERLLERRPADEEMREQIEGAASRFVSDTDPALRLHNEAAYEAARRLHGEQHLHTATRLFNLGIVAAAELKFDEAFALMRRAIATNEALLGADHLAVLDQKTLLADQLVRRKKMADVVELLEPIAATVKSVAGPKSRVSARLLQSLAVAYHDQGRTTEALELNAEALSVYGELKVPRLQAFTLLDRADMEASRHERLRAKALLNDTRALLAKNFGPDDPDIFSAYEQECAFELTGGHPVEALAACEAALKGREQSHDEAAVGFVRSLMGRAWAARQNDALARRELELAIHSLETTHLDDDELARARAALALVVQRSPGVAAPKNLGPQ